MENFITQIEKRILEKSRNFAFGKSAVFTFNPNIENETGL